MKLKRLFSAKKIFAAGFLAASFLFSSCASNDLSVPVPGQGAVKTRNIYVEYYMLGDAYFKLEDYKKAGEYYELAMRKKDQYWAAYYKLAKCYVFGLDSSPVYAECQISPSDFLRKGSGQRKKERLPAPRPESVPPLCSYYFSLRRNAAKVL